MDYEVRSKMITRDVLLKDGSIKTYNINTTYKCKKNAHKKKIITYTEDEKKIIIDAYNNLKYPNYSRTYNDVKDKLDTTYHYVRKIIIEYIENGKNGN